MLQATSVLVTVFKQVWKWLQIIEIVNTCSLTSWIFMFQKWRIETLIMTPVNESIPVEFILLGFSDQPWLEFLLFCGLLHFLHGDYLWESDHYSSVTPGLQTPDSHVFLLTNLSLLDLCYTTSTVPQLLVNLHSTRKVISYGGCVAQLFIFLALGPLNVFCCPSCPLIGL